MTGDAFWCFSILHFQAKYVILGKKQEVCFMERTFTYHIPMTDAGMTIYDYLKKMAIRTPFLYI